MHMIAGVLQYVAVASFAEAWIENIWTIHRWKAFSIVASFAEAWIENVSSSISGSGSTSPPSRRRGLKNLIIKFLQNLYSRLLRGGVDWKNLNTPLYSLQFVASFAEAWIENLLWPSFVWLIQVASFAEAWIENPFLFFDVLIITSPPSRRRGLKMLLS